MIGIDLGLTTACVALYKKDTRTVQILENSLGQRTTPCCVLYENSNGDITIGKEARGDDTCIYDAKRLIGKKFSDKDVQELIPTLGFNVSAGRDGKCMIDVPNIGLYSPEQIIADILESMRLIVEMHFDRQLS